MKIFITNLGRYNEGYLVGKWVKLPVCEDVLDKVLKEIGINEYMKNTSLPIMKMTSLV